MCVHTGEPLYKGHSEKGHLSKEGTVCNPDHTDLCRSLPLN